MGKLLTQLLDFGFELLVLGAQSLQLNVERVAQSVLAGRPTDPKLTVHAFCAFSIACLAAILAMTSSSCLSASSRVLAVNVPGAPDSERLM